MEISAFALWLNTAMAGFDGAVLSALHSVAQFAGVVLTPLMKLITLIGEKGLIYFLLALGLMCFSRTRKIGVCLFGAVCCGALITNIILKDWIARPRPFESFENFRLWWEFVGSPAEDGFSFPSGHVTATASAMMALSLMLGKRLIAPSAAWVALMAISRNYLMAHYPTDAIAAIIVGFASAFIAWMITKLIYRILEDNDHIGLFAFILDFDLPLSLPTKSKYKGKHEA